MSRSGYSDDCSGWDLIRWRGAVRSAIRGKRGQQFLRVLLAALEAMPEKQLIANELEADGKVCALGAIGRARHLSMQDLDPYDDDQMASTFGIAPALAKEIMFLNDDDFYPTNETLEARWSRMRKWVSSQLEPT